MIPAIRDLVQPSLFDDITRRRHRGAPTSDAAHEAVKPFKSPQRQIVWDFVAGRGSLGATVAEIAERLSMPYTTASARASELVRDRDLLKSDRKRRTATGCQAAVLIAARYSTLERTVR